MARTINQQERQEKCKSVDIAISELTAQGEKVTKAAIADYIGVSKAYLSHKDPNGAVNYLAQYIDLRLAEIGAKPSPEDRIQNENEKKIKEQTRTIQKLTAQITQLEAALKNAEDCSRKWQDDYNKLIAYYLRQPETTSV